MNLKQKLELNGDIFCFQAKSFEEKEAWIGAIGIIKKNYFNNKIL